MQHNELSNMPYPQSTTRLNMVASTRHFKSKAMQMPIGDPTWSIENPRQVTYS